MQIGSSKIITSNIFPSSQNPDARDSRAFTPTTIICINVHCVHLCGYSPGVLELPAHVLLSLLTQIARNLRLQAGKSETNSPKLVRKVFVMIWKETKKKKECRGTRRTPSRLNLPNRVYRIVNHLAYRTSAAAR